MNKNKIFTSLNKINWKAPTKLYSPRASAPDITIEEKSQIFQNKYSANSIDEWNV